MERVVLGICGVVERVGAALQHENRRAHVGARLLEGEAREAYDCHHLRVPEQPLTEGDVLQAPVAEVAVGHDEPDPSARFGLPHA